MLSESNYEQVLWACTCRNGAPTEELDRWEFSHYGIVTWLLAAISSVQTTKPSLWKLGVYRNTSFLHSTHKPRLVFGPRSFLGAISNWLLFCVCQGLKARLIWATTLTRHSMLCNCLPHCVFVRMCFKSRSDDMLRQHAHQEGVGSSRE